MIPTIDYAITHRTVRELSISHQINKHCEMVTLSSVVTSPAEVKTFFAATNQTQA